MGPKEDCIYNWPIEMMNFVVAAVNKKTKQSTIAALCDDGFRCPTYKIKEFLDRNLREKEFAAKSILRKFPLGTERTESLKRVSFEAKICCIETNSNFAEKTECFESLGAGKPPEPE